MSQVERRRPPRPIRCDVVEVFTVEQFLRLPEIKPPLEFIAGRIEQKMSPKMRHALIQEGILLEINSFARPRRLGRAFIELRCSFGGESHVPDVAFYARGRLPKDESGEYLDDVYLAPDLMVEILSPGQTITTLSSRMARCLANGVRMAWLIQPKQRRVFVFRPGHPRESLDEAAALSGHEVLPGFTLPVATLFGWLKADD